MLAHLRPAHQEQREARCRHHHHHHHHQEHGHAQHPRKSGRDTRRGRQRAAVQAAVGRWWEVYGGRVAVSALWTWLSLAYAVLLRWVAAPLGLLGPLVPPSLLLPADLLLVFFPHHAGGGAGVDGVWTGAAAVLRAGFVGMTVLLAWVVGLHLLLLRSRPGFVPLGWAARQRQQQPLADDGGPTHQPGEAAQVHVELVVVDPHERESSGEGKEADEHHREGEAPAYCHKCNGPRPPRARHCRICKRCVLKMDHHCPWVNNCVGNNNFKLFFLFLCYGTLLGLLASAFFLVAIVLFWQQWDDMPDDLFWREGALIVINCWLSLAATSHIGVMAASMWVNLTENTTTLEHLILPRPRLRHQPHLYDLGRELNVRQVMGPAGWERWLNPFTPPTTDGFSFPTRSS